MLSWIDDQVSRGVELNEAIIREKAKKVYGCIEENASTTDNFVASAGWFASFKSRLGVRSVKMSGESASVNPDIKDKFVEEFKKIAQDYLPEQIFNVDETGLFWKLRRGRTYTTENQPKVAGEKKDKKRVSILLGREIK